VRVVEAEGQIDSRKNAEGQKGRREERSPGRALLK